MSWVAQTDKTHVRVTSGCAVRVTEAGVIRVSENNDELHWCDKGSVESWSEIGDGDESWSET